MNMTLIWLFIAIATGVFEAITVDLVSIWFCAGAIAAMLLAYFDAAIWLQITAFIAVAIILILVTRPLAKKMLRGNVVHTNSDRLIGKHGIVTRKITMDEHGEVKVAGEYWTAATRDNVDIDVDNHVEILAIEGVKLIVRPTK